MSLVTWPRVKALLTLAGLSRKWQVAVHAVVGLALGVGLLAAHVGNAASYLSDSPETCMNCHVMTDAYVTWQRGSHGKVAKCIDCHVPHTNPIAQMAFKGMDGTKHATVFTLRREPQVMRLSKMAVPVVRENCLRCHHNQFQMVRLAASSERNCWDCHTNIHGKVHSLSASPRVLRPSLPAAGLKWMKQGDKK